MLAEIGVPFLPSFDSLRELGERLHPHPPVRDHEFMLYVECDDADIAEGLNVSRECNQGTGFGQR